MSLSDAVGFYASPQPDVPRRDPALLIKITPARSGEISAAKFMKLSRFIVLNELAFPKRSPSDKRFCCKSRSTEAERGGGRPPRAGAARENRAEAESGGLKVTSSRRLDCVRSLSRPDLPFPRRDRYRFDSSWDTFNKCLKY